MAKTNNTEAARTAYQAHRNTALKLLAQMTADLEASENEAPHWGDAGSMEHLANRLVETAISTTQDWRIQEEFNNGSEDAARRMLINCTIED